MVVKGSDLNFEKEVTLFSLFGIETLSPLSLSILGVFTLIAVMSTIDTQVQLFTSALTKNILNINIKDDRKKFIEISRWATFILLSLMAIFASMVGSSMEFILKAFSFAYILAPILIVSMIWGPQGNKFKDISCFISLSSGLLVYGYMFFNGHFNQMINNVIPAGITFAICFLSMIVFKVFYRKN